jgi:DNA-binding CsgD family transcriptional regulator
VDEGGIWRLRGAQAPSDRLIELVEARLAGLDPAERELLELLSFGEPLGAAELTALAEPALAEHLERRALLSSGMNGRRIEVRLAHPLYGEVLRARLPALRIRSIVRSLADAVEATGARRREDTLRVASWRLLGGGGRPDVMLAGSWEARWRYDFPLAERLARAAVDAGAGFDAQLLAAQLASLQGRAEDAETELAALAAAAEGDEQHSLVALTRIDNSVIFAGQHDELRFLDEVESVVTDPVWRDELEGKRLALLQQRTTPRVFVEAAEALLKRASGGALAFISLPAGWSLGRLGRIGEALDITARGKAARLTATTPQPWYPWWQDWIAGHSLIWAGRLDEAEEIASAHYRQALADGSTEGQGAFADFLAYIAVERGHVQTAARRAREAAALNQQLGRPIMVRFAYVHGSLALALAGDGAAGARFLAALDAMEVPALFFDRADVLQARAWVAAANGHLREAHEHLEAAARLGDQGDPVGAASALHGLARLGWAAEVHERLADLVGEIEGPMGPARADHAAALVGSDPARLEQASRDFEAMGADLLAAEAAADAAVAWRRSGHARQATAAQHRAALVGGRCEGAVTPALRSIEARVRLTAAERETAVRAAAGASNKQIASELHLSVRTVENRLQRVYDKLGVKGRSGLPDVFSDVSGP